MNRILLRLTCLIVLLALTPLAPAVGVSDYLENKFVDHLFRATSFTAPSTLCVGLWQSSATLNDASTGATSGEMSYTGYARGQLNPSVSNWKGTGGETSGASAGTSAQTKNAVTITFGSAATSGPQTAGFVVVLDSCTIGAGNVLFYAALSANKTINNGDPAPTFPVDALVITVTD